MKRNKSQRIHVEKLAVILLVLFGMIAIVAFGKKSNEGLRAAEARTTSYISTVEELLLFAASVNTGNEYEDMVVVLQNDLDMNGVEKFVPIGNYDGDFCFKGIFDGQGHTIKNLRITPECGSVNNGLFGALDGIICNLTIEDSYIEGSACGAFCSIAKTRFAGIYNCVARDVEINAPYTEIVAGQYYGEMDNCLIDGYICSENAEFAHDITELLAEEVDIDAYNEKLTELSIQCKNLPMCKWKDEGVLDEKSTVVSSEMYLTINDLGNKEILYPFHKNNCYYFVVPIDNVTGTCTLYVPEDRSQGYVVKNMEGGCEQEIHLENSEYQVKICYTKNTPSVLINTERDEGIGYLQKSKDNIVYSANIKVLDEKGYIDYAGGIENIHGRGNDSWKERKKSFSIDLTKVADLLGMGADKEYALLAGYRDASLLSYKIVADLAKEMELEYAPEYRFVNLYMDGKYQGLYILAEKMTIGYNRINISDANRDVTGGYIYEMDNEDYHEELCTFQTESGMIYVMKEPIVGNDAQVEYSTNLLDSFEKAIYSPTGYDESGVYYGEYIDIDSMAKWITFMEINCEYSANSSVYFYKDSDSKGDGKLHMLYPWDVEHSFALPSFVNILLVEGENINAIQSHGIWAAAYSHPDMKKAIWENYTKVFKPALCKLLVEETGDNSHELSYIGAYAERYSASSKWNEILWGEEQSIENKAIFIQNFLTERIKYLDEALKYEE